MATVTPQVTQLQATGVRVQAQIETIGLSPDRARSKILRAAQLKGFRNPEIINFEVVEGEGKFGVPAYRAEVRALR